MTTANRPNQNYSLQDTFGLYSYNWNSSYLHIIIPIILIITVTLSIGGGHRGDRGAMAPLKFKAFLYRNLIFAIENHFSLEKCPPYIW